MKRYLFFIVIIVIFLNFASLILAAEVQTSNSSDYQIMSEQNLSDESKVDIFSINLRTKEKKLLATTWDSSFHISPDKKRVVIRTSSKLEIIDIIVNTHKVYTVNDLSSGREPFLGDIGLLKWSDDSQTYWVDIFVMTEKFTYTKINVSTWTVIHYDVTKIPLENEILLNPNNEKIVYTDLPVQISDIDINENKKNHLYLYDFITQKQILISASDAKAFNPKWIDDNTIEYDNPNGEGRIRYNISQ